MAKHYVYRFYAELMDYKPKIWRRFEINGEKTMAELGYAIMLLFEMQASHLFCFIEDNSDFTKNIRYELPSDDTYLNGDERLIGADGIKLNHITDHPGWKLTFEYDYGDGWEVALTLEQCEKREVSLAGLPCVLEGEGFGIIEDVGGVTGLGNLAKAFKKGKGKEYYDFCEWLGTITLDLTAFDIDDMNFRLKKLIRVYKEIYEYHYEPTERSLGLLLREYKHKGVRGY